MGIVTTTDRLALLVKRVADEHDYDQCDDDYQKGWCEGIAAMRDVLLDALSVGEEFADAPPSDLEDRINRYCRGTCAWRAERGHHRMCGRCPLYHVLFGRLAEIASSVASEAHAEKEPTNE